jgi:RNA polymerase sigma-70 factor, ECF subfamily
MATDRLQQLMIKTQAGDRHAYDELLRNCLRLVKSVYRQKMFSQEAVDDLAQETLIALHKSRHTYQPGRPFLPWLMAIAKYKYIDYLRKWNRRERLNVEVPDDLTQPATETGSQTKPSIGEAWEKAIASLPEKQRCAVTLLKVEGLSVREAALKLGIKDSALKVNAHRGYKRLRAILSSQAEFMVTSLDKGAMQKSADHIEEGSGDQKTR